MCRSRRELSNEYLLAKIGVDTAENEPLEVWGKIWENYSILFNRVLSGDGEILRLIHQKLNQFIILGDGPEVDAISSFF